MAKAKSLLDPVSMASSPGKSTTLPSFVEEWVKHKYQPAGRPGLILRGHPARPAHHRLALLAHADGLVHALLGDYNAHWVSRTENEDPWPVEAMTDCGLAMVLKEAGFAYDRGLLVPDQALTCMRCIAGDRTALEQRQVAKTLLFAQRYGATGRTLDSLRSAYAPPMQQIPRKR